MSDCLHIQPASFFFLLQQEHKDKFKLDEAKFSDFICLEEPKFTHSKAPVKTGGKKKNKRSEEEVEILNQARAKAKENKEAQLKQSKDSKLKGMLTLCTYRVLLAESHTEAELS